MQETKLPEKPDRCGNCTLCCTLFEVPQLDKAAGEDCVNCAVNQGCKIWQSRPQVCRDFQCAYYQDDRAHIDLRPDHSKMIFEKISDRIFFGTQDPRHAITQVAQAQIRSFRDQGYSVFIASQGSRPALYLAPGHEEKEIKSEYKQYLIKWKEANGGAFVHH